MPELIIKYIWLTFYIESFYYWNTLNFEIAPLIIGLTAQQSITTLLLLNGIQIKQL